MNSPRWWYTLRYHRLSQLAWRGVTIVRRRTFPFLSHARYDIPNKTSFALRHNTGFNAIVARHLAIRSKQQRCGKNVLSGQLEFLNERRTLTLPFDWQLKSVEPVSHLWRFHLHYHEFLLDLLRSAEWDGADEAKTRLWAIIDDWIKANPVGRPGALTDAWHPFCLSKRVAVWLMVWQASAPPDTLRSRFASSIEGQVRYLERHLEWDLRGNHLLENLRTLVLVGAFFTGDTSERRLDRALTLLDHQLSEQILPSGEHFERSPMYHAQMLNAVLDVRDAVKEIRPQFATRCTEIAERMGELLQIMVHPDGQVALLSDTALGETPHADVLLNDVRRHDPQDDLVPPVGSELRPAEIEDLSTGDDRCQLPPGPSSEIAIDPAISEKQRPTIPRFANERPKVLKRGDYWRWEHKGDSVLFDAGPVGADELPAHAHCDLLSIEASIAGRRVIVDSGVYDYSGSEMRQYCRSTKAHNVLQIDDAEQCDMWSRFRVGYRGHPSPLTQGETEEFAWSRATHNAYRRVGVPAVGRWLACRAGGPWFCVDWAWEQDVRQGGALRQLVSRLHLSPDVKVTPITSNAVGIRLGERSLELHSLTDAQISTEAGWYCPDFGIRQETTVLTFETKATLPAGLGWSLQDAGHASRSRLESGANGECHLTWEHGDSVTVFKPFDIDVP